MARDSRRGKTIVGGNSSPPRLGKNGQNSSQSDDHELASRNSRQPGGRQKTSKAHGAAQDNGTWIMLRHTTSFPRPAELEPKATSDAPEKLF
jgi:hypothetical protein